MQKCWCKEIAIDKKLEAQWAEPVSLTFCFEETVTEKQLQRRRFLEID